MKRLIQLALAAMLIQLSVHTLNSQTIIISPMGDGGFENGSTFAANGWTVANDDSNAWYLGSVTFYNGTRGAYVDSLGGVSNVYRTNAAQVSHFYRDVTFPAGQTVITLSFVWKGQGEGASTPYDYLAVFLVPTSTTPTPGVLLSSGQIGTAYRLVGTYTPVTIVIPGSNAGTTQRLVFSW